MGWDALNDDTKILTLTDTETFFLITNFPKPKPRLFSETKFFETETETVILKPKPSKIWQKFRNQEISKPKCQSLAMIN